MQMKSSYRVLKWMFLVGAMATLGTACVVTSGDGDDEGEGGEGGTDTTTAGKNSTSGSGGTSTAGTSSGGKGGTASAGTNAGGMAAGGEGGAAYVPGLCEADSPTPTVEPSCDPLPKDDEAGRECVKCLKASCCTEWQTCFGDAPTTACGYGPTDGSPGQFECVLDCFDKGKATAADEDDLIEECTASCVNQCGDADNGLPLSATADLIECANGAACKDDCLNFAL